MKNLSTLSQVAERLERSHHLSPQKVVKAQSLVTDNCVKKVSASDYQVTSQTDAHQSYHVNPLTPDCECKDFEIINLPQFRHDGEPANICKHIIAVWLYNSLPDVPELSSEEIRQAGIREAVREILPIGFFNF